MIVDRRKDSYDELMTLSRDSRLKQTNNTRQTASWILGAVVAVSVYVGATLSQLGDIADARSDAERQLNEAKSNLAKVSAERDYYRDAADWFQDLADTLNDDADIDRIIQNFPQPVPADGTARPTSVASTTLSNVVWVVDGSRRFPMTEGDILWIPEINLWVRMGAETGENPRVPGRRLRQMTLHYGSAPATPSDGGKAIQLGGAYLTYEEGGDWGSFNCVQLTLHYQSARPAFSANPDYADMEVLLNNRQESCPGNGRNILVRDDGSTVDLMPQR